jgi:heme/copper-type cytochrome/quinol oxidase subunit 2
VRDGEPVGGVKRLEYERGERVRFSVKSDVADEVHVHGFDVTRDVPANRSVRFAFPADIEGVFEVELHDAHIKIAELRVRP